MCLPRICISTLSRCSWGLGFCPASTQVNEQYHPLWRWKTVWIHVMCVCRDASIHFQISWPTPHAADPSLYSMSFLGTSWHDLICIGSLVLSYWRNVTWHCIIHRKAIPEALILGHILSKFVAILSEFGSLGPSWDHLGISKVSVCIPSFHFRGF